MCLLTPDPAISQHCPCCLCEYCILHFESCMCTVLIVEDRHNQHFKLSWACKRKVKSTFVFSFSKIFVFYDRSLRCKSFKTNGCLSACTQDSLKTNSWHPRERQPSMEPNTGKLLNAAMATTSQLGVMLPWRWYPGHAQFSGISRTYWQRREQQYAAKTGPNQRNPNKSPLFFISVHNDWNFLTYTVKYFKPHLRNKSKVSLTDCSAIPSPPHPPDCLSSSSWLIIHLPPHIPSPSWPESHKPDDKTWIWIRSRSLDSDWLCHHTFTISMTGFKLFCLVST